jgi:hypothetical protein
MTEAEGDTVRALTSRGLSSRDNDSISAFVAKMLELDQKPPWSNKAKLGVKEDGE